MKTTPRLTITPATAIALVSLFFALGGSAFALGDKIQSPFANQKRCANGAVRGVAVVTGDARIGIANMPDKFSGAAALFERRFNCTGKAVQVRRIDRGVYEVRFTGVAGASGLAGARGPAAASVRALPGGVFEVTVFGAGSAAPDDLGFTLFVM